MIILVRPSQPGRRDDNDDGRDPDNFRSILIGSAFGALERASMVPLLWIGLGVTDLHFSLVPCFSAWGVVMIDLDLSLSVMLSMRSFLGCVFPHCEDVFGLVASSPLLMAPHSVYVSLPVDCCGVCQVYHL